MSSPASTSNPATAYLRGLLALLGLLCCALPCEAGRLVRVYEVDIEGQSPAALQEAMRQALVRATGRRESADDPALANLVSDAPRYVKTYGTGPRGEAQVVFDGAAIERAIAAAGRSMWQRERPFTLVVLDPPRPRTAEDAARAELERVAAERGLPISLIPLPLNDGAGNPLGADALLHAAQRYGGDEILVGRGADAGPDTPLQWTLYTRALSSSWSGPLTGAIDHTVDVLVPQPATSLADADATARVQIDGVNSLVAYAAVERLLQSTPGVRRANIAAADAGSVTFEVTARGGAAGLGQALAGSTRLVHASGTGDSVVYRYQPQG
ncbi:MAG TPA: DUF2066 domain-containing protein [Steroidobacteraceae bacterium]|jgi:hypothetical protein|nr:DUF2066 domain-containing protein [Steroidobacteraceae bacterium]